MTHQILLLLTCQYHKKKTFQAATINLHQQKKYSDLLQSQLMSLLSVFSKHVSKFSMQSFSVLRKLGGFM